MRTQGLSTLVILIATLLGGCCCGSKSCRLAPAEPAPGEPPALHAAAGRPPNVSHADYSLSAGDNAEPGSGELRRAAQ